MNISLAAFFLVSTTIAVPAVAQESQGTPVVSETSALKPATAALTNDDIVKLLAAGIGEPAIIAKIKSAPSQFDLSTDHLIALSSKGVTSNILAAMLDAARGATVAKEEELSLDSPDPSVPHYTGVYLMMDGVPEAKMQRINPTASNQAKTGGILGYALTMGIASMSVKAAIPNDAARITTKSGKPVFYFFFDESVPKGASNGSSTWINGVGTIVSSPAELTLTQFVVKKGRREARVGSVNIAGAKSGVMDKDQIAFESELVRPGVFRVVPTSDLAAGQYGFIHAMSGGNTMAGGGAMTARVFDFAVAK
ncbi:hypothetical protein [Sphingosinicella sp.]|uniref:hypothetical protein n=1 Tax=Sphingosinicella sp. TaxID=1917971 RepID=UPI00261E8DF6|nr:hypothetical protein [Sphingosinicella sp.]